MDLDTRLADTFAAHEHLVPDQDDVLAAVNRRIRHGRSAYTRPLAVAASIALVVGAVGGAVSLSHHRGHAPAGNVQAASDHHQAASEQRTGDQTGGIEPVDYVARRINVGAENTGGAPLFDGEYMLTVTTSDTALDVDVQQFPGDLQDAAFKSGPGGSVTIAGRPGIESTNAGGPGGYEVYFQDAAGGLMYVNVAAHPGESAPSAAQLTTIGRQVAGNVTFPGTAQVSPSFGIGYVPAGLKVRAFDVEGLNDLPFANGATGPTTSYELGTAGTLESAAYVGTNSLPPSGTSGRDVQGHPTSYLDDQGYRTLSVRGAVDGQTVSISSGSLSLAELYDIADGLKLP
jgi:hypothetical protein